MLPRLRARWRQLGTDLVIVDTGSNNGDCWLHCPQQTTSKSEAQLKRDQTQVLIHQLLSLRPLSAIVYVETGWMLSYWTEAGGKIDAHSEPRTLFGGRYYYAAAVKAYGVPTVSLPFAAREAAALLGTAEGGGFGRDSLYIDPIHMSRAGHNLLALLLASMITRQWSSAVPTEPNAAKERSGLFLLPPATRVDFTASDWSWRKGELQHSQGWLWAVAEKRGTGPGYELRPAHTSSLAQSMGSTGKYGYVAMHASATFAVRLAFRTGGLRLGHLRSYIGQGTVVLRVLDGDGQGLAGPWLVNGSGVDRVSVYSDEAFGFNISNSSNTAVQHLTVHVAFLGRRARPSRSTHSFRTEAAIRITHKNEYGTVRTVTFMDGTKALGLGCLSDLVDPPRTTACALQQ
jgi:hypothetical protein